MLLIVFQFFGLETPLNAHMKVGEIKIFSGENSPETPLTFRTNSLGFLKQSPRPSAL